MSRPFVDAVFGHVAWGDANGLRSVRDQIEIQPGIQGSELACVESDQGRLGAVVAIGDISAAVTWSPRNNTAGKFARATISSGRGCLYDAPSVATVRKLLKSGGAELRSRIRSEGLVGLEDAGRVVGVAFSCGAGDREYLLLRGYDETGRPVAAAVDLQVGEQAVEAIGP